MNTKLPCSPFNIAIERCHLLTTRIRTPTNSNQEEKKRKKKQQNKNITILELPKNHTEKRTT